ncbi:unnamed protein product [Leptosia nina]|uniref:Uncharacterized protein n=1 Tax=Leptosia nina TaxID=320188 RepID=A0AAV1IYB4_9NEOP
MPFNRTFFDKSDNILRVPNTFYEDNKRKSKIKKSPKRTIQKIIKKNTVKRKRIYVNPVTSLPTVSTMYNKADNIHSRQNDDTQTTEANSRRRPRKNSKVLRYHMPFHKLQPRTRRNKREDIKVTKKEDTTEIENVIKKNKRDADNENVVILNDLDEIEFVGDDKDYDVVKAHVQYNW